MQTEWIRCPVCGNIVRRIFRLCVEGHGPTQIANILFSEGVPTPAEYWHSQGRKTSALPAVPHKRAARTIADILDRQEYIGDTVNLKFLRFFGYMPSHIEPMPKSATVFHQ